MRDRFASLADVLAHLDRLGLFHMDLSLERMAAFAAGVGLSRPPYLAFHVVGTNGKGSTSAFLDSLLRSHGVPSGLYSSPHFADVRERVKLGGELLSEDAFLAAANRIGPAADALGLTYFEFLTALALDAFCAARVRAAVLEAGLGGRFDAVTVCTRDSLLYTPIGLDHMKVLGPDVAAIARDKAGAMRPGLPVLTAPQPPEALAELRGEAERLGCPFTLVEPLSAAVPLGLAGEHQRVNAALALAAFRAAAPSLGIVPDGAAEARGLASAFLPGRLQRIPPLAPGGPEIILDGAHNAPGLAALGAALAGLDIRPSAVVFSCFADKDPAALAPPVLALTDGPVFVPRLLVEGRPSDPAAVAAALGPRASVCASLDEALGLASGRTAAAEAGPLLICGSLYLLAGFFTKHPRFLHSPDVPAPAGA